MNMNDTVRVTKKFTIDMAHALFGYDGPCKNIHGHTYHLSVTVIGNVEQATNNPKQGMVVDFADLKKLVKSEIVDVYDHALVLNEDAPYSKNDIISNQFEKVVLTPFQPSCENLLLHFKNSITDKVPAYVKLCSIKLEETPTSYAEWFMSDNI
jgi:6-pyruvoyltetrahydropterin/6-carboxytetrahydropterin synthase